MTLTVTIFMSISLCRKWKADSEKARTMSTFMRHFILLIVFATPASAWDFSPVPVCTVSHQTSDAAIELTYDAARSEPYAIAVTSPKSWTEGRIFGLRFEGGNALTITTDRQTIEGKTLTVRDQGFGNVLNGLQFNATVTAFAGDVSLAFSLDGASLEIARFRECLLAPTA